MQSAQNGAPRGARESPAAALTLVHVSDHDSPRAAVADPLFGSLGVDLALAAALGAAGGLGLAVVQERSLEWPARQAARGEQPARVALGFISDLIVGAVAALVTYGVNPPSDAARFVSTLIVAGIGGTAILQSYVADHAANRHQARATFQKTRADLLREGLQELSNLGATESATSDVTPTGGGVHARARVDPSARARELLAVDSRLLDAEAQR